MGTNLITTSTYFPTVSTWALMEVYYLPHISAGSFIVKVNGVTVLTVSGVKTAPSTTDIDTIKFDQASGAFMYLDDIIFDDANWIGSSSIQKSPVTGAGATAGFTPSLDQSSVYSDSGYLSYTFGSSMNLRTLLPASEISGSGSVIQLTIKNGSGSTVLGGCSIGERSGTTFDFTSTPTRVTFGGSNTKSMTADEECVSDVIAFALDETKDYLVHIYLSSTPYYTYKSKGSNYCADNVNGGDDTLVQSSSGYVVRAQAYSVIDLSVGGGNSFCVEEIPPSDADYIYTNTPNVVDTYVCGDLTGTINSVKAVQVQARCMIEGDTDVPKLQLVTRPASTDRVSESKDVTTFMPKSVFNVWNTNPEDSQPWEAADVNGMEIGVKAVAS
jgi:hypothetical protein